MFRKIKKFQDRYCKFKDSHISARELKKTACTNCGCCCLKCPCFLNKKDLEKISSFLKISPQVLFQTKLCVAVESNETFVLMPIRKNQKDIAGRYLAASRTWDFSECIFRKKGGCLIHKVKPIEGKKYKCWEKSGKPKNTKWTLEDFKKLKGDIK